MNYLRYHRASGAIHSKIISDVAPAETDDIGVMVGDADQARHWIDAGEIMDRTDWTDAEVVGLIGQGGDPVAVITGLPEGAWVTIRGTGRMAFAQQMRAAEGGALMIAPQAAGTYVVTLTGAYRGPAMLFEAVSLDDLKQRRVDEVNAAKTTAIGGGAVWNGHRWDVSDSALLPLSARVSAIRAGIELPVGFYWTDFDNADVSLDADGVVALAQALNDFTFAVHDRSRVLKAAINDAATFAEVLALDVGAGWPE